LKNKASKEESDDDNYDQLNFNQFRRTQSAGVYSRITPQKQDEMDGEEVPLRKPKKMSAWDEEAAEEMQRNVEEQRAVVASAVEAVNGRLDRMEDRLTAIEQQSRESLYNIEALLRSAVFYGSQPASRQSRRSRYFEDC
jgi:hypothetical protein